MSFFKQVEGEAAVIVENGVYKQCDLYTRGEFIYAKVGGGFIRLMYDGSTSKAKCRLVHISWTERLFRVPTGGLVTGAYGGKKLVLEMEHVVALLGMGPA